MKVLRTVTKIDEIRDDFKYLLESSLLENGADIRKLSNEARYMPAHSQH